MIDVRALLYEVCGEENVLQDDTDLFETGLLDSLALIELLGLLEDAGVVLSPTRINRTLLRTPAGIDLLVREAEKKQ